MATLGEIAKEKWVEELLRKYGFDQYGIEYFQKHIACPHCGQGFIGFPEGWGWRSHLASCKEVKILDDKMYRRGRDYPPYAKGKVNAWVKMSIAMQGKEVKEWFTEEELKGYPKPDAYTGSLP